MLLCDMMSLKQKEDLKEIGFDGLFHVNLLKSFHGIMCLGSSNNTTLRQVFLLLMKAPSLQ